MEQINFKKSYLLTRIYGNWC